MPPVSIQELSITGAGFTHKGLVRDKNEDAILLDPRGELWAVADGMGGYGRGDVAADQVIDVLAELAPIGDAEAALVKAVEASNAAIFAEAKGELMGATVAAIYIDAGCAYGAWVGDSRIYLWRNGKLSQISKDHSRVQDLIDTGLISEAEASAHPERHVVTRAVGAAHQVEVETAVVPLLANDRLLICSDGLSGTVDAEDLTQILRLNRPDNATAARMLQAALDAGAPDNVSVIVVTAKGT